MKKSVIILSSVLLFAACINNQGTATEDTTNTAQTEQVAEEPQSAFELTDKGVDPILLGMKINNVPESVEGLYDKYTKTKYYLDFGTHEITFSFTKDGLEVMTANAYTNNNKIASITVIDTKLIKVDSKNTNANGNAFVFR